MSELIRILLLENDCANAARISNSLAQANAPYQLPITRASNCESARTAIRRREHDVCLVGYMGEQSGLELIEEALREGVTNPFVLLTSARRPPPQHVAAPAGAVYYLDERDLNPLELEQHLRFCLDQSRQGGPQWQFHQQIEAQVEVLVAQRTQAVREQAELLRERAEASQRALEKERDLHELKMRFITMASHEFRTPMSTILSAAGLIDRYQGPADSPQRARNVARIREAIADLTGILDDFLDTNKTSGKLPPVEPVSLDLPTFVDDVLAGVQHTLRPGQHISYAPAGPPGLLWIDGYILRYILINLLSNASKYSYDQSEICLTTCVSEAQLRLCVRDFGIGIEEQDGAHLFSNFFRGRNALHLQGTGLGLYLVRLYVELLGGQISFVSELGKGTTFTVLLPLTPVSL